MELAVAVRERGLGQDTVPQLGQRRSHHLFVVDQFGLNGPHFYSNGRV